MVMRQAQTPQQWAICRGEPTPAQCNLCLRISRCMFCSRPGLDCITFVMAYILRVQARCASIASMGRQSVLAGACCTSNHCLAEAPAARRTSLPAARGPIQLQRMSRGSVKRRRCASASVKEHRVRPHFAGHTLQLQQNLVKRTPAAHMEAAAATAPFIVHQAGSETAPCDGANGLARGAAEAFSALAAILLISGRVAW